MPTSYAQGSFFCVVVIGMASHNETFSPRSIVWILGTLVLVFLKKVLLVHFKIVKGQEARRARNGAFFFGLSRSFLPQFTYSFS